MLGGLGFITEKFRIPLLPQCLSHFVYTLILYSCSGKFSTYHTAVSEPLSMRWIPKSIQVNSFEETRGSVPHQFHPQLHFGLLAPKTPILSWSHNISCREPMFAWSLLLVLFLELRFRIFPMILCCMQPVWVA